MRVLGLLVHQKHLEAGLPRTKVIIRQMLIQDAGKEIWGCYVQPRIHLLCT